MIQSIETKLTEDAIKYAAVDLIKIVWDDHCKKIAQDLPNYIRQSETFPDHGVYRILKSEIIMIHPTTIEVIKLVFTSLAADYPDLKPRLKNLYNLILNS